PTHLPLPGCEPCSLLRARQEDSKRAADSEFTLDVHLAAVRGNDVLNHSQPQTRTSGSSSFSAGGPNELLEDLPSFMRGDPKSFIAYAECDPSILAVGLRPYDLVLGGVFHRIVQQIPERPCQGIAVGFQGRQMGLLRDH